MSLQTIEDPRRAMTLPAHNFIEESPRPLTNRPNLYETRDIPGASPRAHTLRRSVAIPGTMDCRDIPGAVSRVPISITTSRHVNPLNPSYVLPTSPPRYLNPDYPLDPVVPRFLGDRHTAADIDGATPSSSPYLARAMRDPLVVADIDGATRSVSPQLRRPIRDIMGVDDINRKRPAGVRTESISPHAHTQTSPLNPSYTIYGSVVADDAVKSRPTQPRPLRSGAQFAMRTADIPGASVPTRRVRAIVRDPNDAADIDGASARGELHNGLTSPRRTDPSAPRYIGLDGACVVVQQLLCVCLRVRVCVCVCVMGCALRMRMRMRTRTGRISLSYSLYLRAHLSPRLRLPLSPHAGLPLGTVARPHTPPLEFTPASQRTRSVSPFRSAALGTLTPL